MVVIFTVGVGAVVVAGFVAVVVGVVITRTASVIPFMLLPFVC